MAGPGTGSKEIAWEHYFRLLLRQKWMVIAPAIAGLLAMGLYSLTLKDLYQGRSSILVEPQSIPTDFMRSTLPYGPETYVRSLVEQIKSLSRLEKIIQEFDLYPRMRSTKSIEEVVAFMRERIEIVRRENETFSVAFSDEDPIKVEKVTNRLTDLFIEENLKFRLDRSSQNVEFLASQARRLRDEVGTQETRIQQFKTKNLDRLPEQRLTMQVQLSAVQQQLQTTGESLVSARAKALSARDRAALLSQANAPGVQGGAQRPDPLEAQIDKTRQDLSQLKTMYSERHPDVQAKQRELSALESQLAARGPRKASPRIVRRAPVSLDAMHAAEEGTLAEAEITRLEAEETRLRDQIKNLNERIEASPRIELELSELTKGLSVLKEEADSFQKKATDAAASYEMERRNQGSQFRALDRARVPSKPISPNRPFLVLLGAGAGLGLGLLMVVGLDLVFRPFLDEHDLAQFANVPVLVSIPHVGPFPSEWERFRGQISSLIALLLGSLPFVEQGYSRHSPLSFSGTPLPSALSDRDLEVPSRPAKAFTYLLGDPILPGGPPRDHVPSWKGVEKNAPQFPVPGIVNGTFRAAGMRRGPQVARKGAGTGSPVRPIDAGIDQHAYLPELERSTDRLMSANAGLTSSGRNAVQDARSAHETKAVRGAQMARAAKIAQRSSTIARVAGPHTPAPEGRGIISRLDPALKPGGEARDAAPSSSTESARAARVATAAVGSRTIRVIGGADRATNASVATAAALRQTRETAPTLAVLDLVRPEPDREEEPDSERALAARIAGREARDGLVRAPDGSYREVSRFRALWPDGQRRSTADIAAALSRVAEDATRPRSAEPQTSRGGRSPGILGTTWGNPARFTIQARLNLGSETSSDETIKELGRRLPWGSRGD